MKTWWQRMVAWWKQWWQWVVAGVGVVGGAVAAIIWRKAASEQPSVDVDVPDPSAALPPLADIGPQAEKIKQVVQDEAKRDDQEAQDAHKAIDAARDIAGVNDVIFGRGKPR